MKTTDDKKDISYDDAVEQAKELAIKIYDFCEKQNPPTVVVHMAVNILNQAFFQHLENTIGNGMENFFVTEPTANEKVN